MTAPCGTTAETHPSSASGWRRGRTHRARIPADGQARGRTVAAPLRHLAQLRRIGTFQHGMLLRLPLLSTGRPLALRLFRQPV